MKIMPYIITSLIKMNDPKKKAKDNKRKEKYLKTKQKLFDFIAKILGGEVRNFNFKINGFWILIRKDDGKLPNLKEEKENA
jgi:hypothetical protein